MAVLDGVDGSDLDRIVSQFPTPAMQLTMNVALGFVLIVAAGFLFRALLLDEAFLPSWWVLIGGTFAFGVLNLLWLPLIVSAVAGLGTAALVLAQVRREKAELVRPDEDAAP